MKDFKDKIVVITDGATGIGKVLVDRFGAEGVKVSLPDGYSKDTGI